MKLYDSYIRVCAVCLFTTLIMLVSEFSDVSMFLCNNHTKEKPFVFAMGEQAGRQQTKDAAMAEADTIKNSADNTGRENYVTEITFSSCEERQLNPRVVEIACIQKKRLTASEAEMDILYRIVQAEAGGEDEMGKKMVADVVVNRVLDEKFPDTISEVVFQSDHGKVQFSPTKDGRFHSVAVSEETVEAVNEALLEEDHTDGALYFVASSIASKDKVSWFERKLTNKGTHGGHTFYR